MYHCVQGSEIFHASNISFRLKHHERDLNHVPTRKVLMCIDYGHFLHLKCRHPLPIIITCTLDGANNCLIKKATSYCRWRHICFHSSEPCRYELDQKVLLSQSSALVTGFRDRLSRPESKLGRIVIIADRHTSPQGPHHNGA